MSLCRYSCVLLVFYSACSSAGALKIPPHFEVHGHRGARATRPENSLPAFQHALEAGVSALEMDMGVSKDMQVVLNHDVSVDTTLCRTQDPSLANLKFPLIHQLTLKQIKTYDCGSIRNQEFPSQVLYPGSKILTLRELLRFLRMHPLPTAKLVKINIETKIDRSQPQAAPSPEKFVDLVAEVIRLENFNSRRVVLQSFDFRTIIYAKEKWPTLKTAALIYKLRGEKSIEDEVQEILNHTKADYLSPHGKLCSEKMIKATHAHGKKVLVWTINKKKDWRYFMKIGVDGIITDDPASLILDISGQSN